MHGRLTSASLSLQRSSSLHSLTEPRHHPTPRRCRFPSTSARHRSRYSCLARTPSTRACARSYRLGRDSSSEVMLCPHKRGYFSSNRQCLLGGGICRSHAPSLPFRYLHHIKRWCYCSSFGRPCARFSSERWLSTACGGSCPCRSSSENSRW